MKPMSTSSNNLSFYLPSNLRINSSLSLPSHTVSRKGFTLMELILTIGLLSILAAASFGVIFWQAKTYYHIEQRSEAMIQLTNTYMVIYKEVKNWSRTGIDTTGSIQLNTSKTATTDFSYNASTKQLSWNGDPILNNAVASFTWHGLSSPEQIVTGTLIKQSNQGGTLKNIAAIKFVIHPRNQ